MASRLNDPLAAAGDLDEAHAKLVEHLVEDLALLGGEVAARLLLEEREDLDHLGRAFEVRGGALAGHRVGQVAEMDRRGARQREHEGGEGQLRLRLGHLVKTTKSTNRSPKGRVKSPIERRPQVESKELA